MVKTISFTSFTSECPENYARWTFRERGNRRNHQLAWSMRWIGNFNSYSFNRIFFPNRATREAETWTPLRLSKDTYSFPAPKLMHTFSARQANVSHRNVAIFMIFNGNINIIYAWAVLRVYQDLHTVFVNYVIYIAFYELIVLTTPKFATA